MSYQIVYSREKHNSLEGVKGKSDEGKFMVLGKAVSDVDGGEGADEDGDTGGGFTIGGDISFYQWDFEAGMPPKDID
jgi:hypothetical protein